MQTQQPQLSQRKLLLLLIMGQEWREREWLWHRSRGTFAHGDFYEYRPSFDEALRRLIALECLTEREDRALSITQRGEDVLVANPTFLAIMRQMSAILALRGGIDP